MLSVDTEESRDVWKMCSTNGHILAWATAFDDDVFRDY